MLPEFGLSHAFAAAAIAVGYIALSSLLAEPQRQQFSAIMLGGAGAAYLSSGLGPWEFVFCSIITFLAFKGLRYYYCIGIGWLLHTGWDVVHHFYARPIVPFSPSSSAGCAVCDAVLAFWFFFKAPAVWPRFRKPFTPIP
jgi:hypothetical protein